MSSSILSIDLEDMEVETKPNLSMQIQQEQNKITEKDENLQHKLVEVETKLRQLEDKNVDLRAQLLAVTEKKKSESKCFSKDNPASNDVKQMYDQLKYKDNRIIDLNNLILEKERRIMDLQEAYREQGQVAQSKQQAVQIVNRRLQELDGREVRHVSTEVDPSLFSDRSSRKSTRNQAINSATQSYSRKNDRNESPEELFRNLRCTSGSPPPIDPSEDMSSYTTETLNMGSMQADRLDESSFEADLIAPLDISPGMSPKQLRKYHRKRVTFDLHQLPNKKKTSSARKSPPVDIKSDVDDLQPLTKSRMAPNNTEDYDYADLVVENDQLRKIIAEMERNASSVKTVESKSENIKELEKVIQQSQHDTKIQVLKARASTQARVKELETALASIRSSSSKEIETLKAINETLKTSREWTLNENGHLLKKISDMKTKLDDLHGELDASVNTNTMFRNRLEEEEKRLEVITQELIQSRRHAQQVADEKQILQNETERLKEALFAQDEFISMLEGDIIVYEAHVGLLKDSLGASKKEDRQNIKSKAFTAKLNALEIEKQEISKRNNDERLRVKALNVKIRCLEQERDELNQRLRHYEQKYGVNRNQPLPNAAVATVKPDTRTQSTQHNTPTYVVPLSRAPEFVNAPLVERLNSIEEPHPPRSQDKKEDHSQCQEQLKLAKEEYEEQLEHEKSLKIALEQEKEKVELSLYELKQEELNLKLQLNRFQEKHAKLELDYDEIQQNTSAFHLLLSDVMSSVLQNLTECCNNEAMPTTISNFKENELLDKLKYVANSVDTTLRSLLDELAKVKTDKESMKEQLKLAKWAVSEMEHVGQEVDTLKQQMEQEKQVLEENWQQVKAMLVEKEKELATVEDIRQDTANQVTQLEVQLAVEKDENTLLKDLRQRLEYRLEEMDKEILEMMVDKEDLEQKLVVLQNDNAYLSATLAREKERLGRLVEMMRMEVEAFRMEAELSRNCLEDLRQNNPNPQDQRPIREMLTNRAWEHMGGGSQTRAYSQPPRATTPVHDQQLQASSSNQRRVVEPQAQVSHDQNSSQLSLETTSVTIDLAKIGNWEEDCGVSVTATLPDVTEDYIGINVMQDLPAAAVHTTALEFFQSHPAARLTPVTFESAIQCELIREVEDKPIRTRSHTMDSLAFHKTSRLIRTISTDDENAGKDIELNLPSLLTDAKMTENKSSAPIISAPKMNSPKVTCSEETQQNSLLLSCVEEAANLEEHFAANVNQLLELNSQLETAVDVLKSEIWSLNNQLRKVQLTEQEELLSKLRHSDDLLLVTRSENSSLKNELNKKEEFINQLKSDLELKSGQLMQVQQDRNRLEEKSNDLAQKLTDLEQQWEDQERLMKQLKEAQSILKMSESQNQALELELAQKEALIVEIKLQFEQKAEELVEIQMDKMKIEQESNALTERFNHLKSTYEQLIAKDKSDRSTETTLEAEVFQPKSCKGCTTTTTPSSSSAQKRVVLASTSSDPNLQLAILAARLVAKTSDNDSLFRVNAELAHSNVELQNAVDMLEDKIKGMSSDSANEDGISLCSQEAEQQETEKISEKESREEPDFEAKSQKMSVSSVPKEACDPQSEEDTEKAIEKDPSIYTQQASDPIESLWTDQDSWQQSLDIKSDVNIPEKSEIVQFPSSQNSEKAAASVKSDAEEWDSNWDDSNWGDDDDIQDDKKGRDTKVGANVAQQVRKSTDADHIETEKEEEDENNDGSWDW